MECLCEHSLLEELREGKPAAYEVVYTLYYPSVARFVRQNKGNEADAKDIFQEAVLLLHQKIAAPEFRLTSTLKTFLYAIAKNLWLKKLRNERMISTAEEQLIAIQDQKEASAGEITVEDRPEEQVHGWLSRITDHCQFILKSLYFSEEPMDRLMLTMGWKNKHTADNQKYKCIQQIRKVSRKEA